MAPGPQEWNHSGARGDTAAREPVAQPFSRPRQSALDRSDRPAQVPRCLLVRMPLEIAENHRHAEALGQPVDLLMQHVPQVVVILGV